MNPLTPNKLLLAKKEMKEFKIPTTKKIEARKKSRGKRLKVGDTSAIDRLTSGATVVSGSAKSSLNTMLSQKRASLNEGDNIVLQIP